MCIYSLHHNFMSTFQNYLSELNFFFPLYRLDIKQLKRTLKNRVRAVVDCKIKTRVEKRNQIPAFFITPARGRESALQMNAEHVSRARVRLVRFTGGTSTCYLNESTKASWTFIVFHLTYVIVSCVFLSLGIPTVWQITMTVK